MILLRVAIIGAGPSGLACALALEQRGIEPDIFERSYRVGLPISAVGATMQLFERPHKGQLDLLERKFGLQIKPLARMRRLVMHTTKRAAMVGGKLGYFVERGQGSSAVEVQLSKQLKSRIKFNIEADYRELAREYEHVVVADGSSMAARDFKIWETTVSAWVKGAIILGRFEPETMIMHFDTGYAKHGYGHLAPFSREKAMLVLVVPDINRRDLSTYWDRFMDKEKMHPEVVETFEWHHTSGLTSRQRMDNVYLVGNAGGFTDGFFGLGLFTGMSGAALAGRAIAEGLDYEKMVRPIMEKMQRIQKLRETFNSLNNGGIDHLVRFITLPLVRQAIYNSNIDVVSFIADTLLKRRDFKKNLPGLRPPASKKE